MMAEVAALMTLAAVLRMGMRTVVEVAAGAARMIGGLPLTNTQVVEEAVVHRAMGAAVDMEIHTEVAAVVVTGELASPVHPRPQIFLICFSSSGGGGGGGGAYSSSHGAGSYSSGGGGDSYGGGGAAYDRAGPSLSSCLTPASTADI
jgi:uncharacterized membrane protein YgcG